MALQWDTAVGKCVHVVHVMICDMYAHSDIYAQAGLLMYSNMCSGGSDKQPRIFQEKGGGLGSKRGVTQDLLCSRL